MSKEETDEQELNVPSAAAAEPAAEKETTAQEPTANSTTNSAAADEMIFTSTFNLSVRIFLLNFQTTNGLFVRAQYVRTRHNNMRCFPQCSKPHKSTSFCGRFVEILVQSTRINAEDAKRALFFGEFRKTSDDPAFVIGNQVERSMLKDQAEKFMMGEFVNDQSTGYHYMFDPKKRWTCLGRIQSGEEFVMTVYLAVNGVVMCCANSPPFQIIPVWKTEDRKRVRTSAHAKHAAAAAAASAATTSSRGSEDDGDVSSEEEDLAQAAARAVFSQMASSTQPHRDVRMLQHHRPFPPFSPTQEYAAMRRFSPAPPLTTSSASTSAAQFSVFQPLQFSQMTPAPSPYSTTPPPILGSGLFASVQQPPQPQQQFQPPARLQTQTPSPPMAQQQHMCHHHLPTQSSSASSTSSLSQFQPLIPPPSSPSRIQFPQPFLPHSPSSNSASLLRQQHQQYAMQQQQQFGGIIMPQQQQQMLPRTLEDLLASSSSAKETGLLHPLPPQSFTSFTLPSMPQQQQQQQQQPHFHPPPPSSSQYRQ